MKNKNGIKNLVYKLGGAGMGVASLFVASPTLAQSVSPSDSPAGNVVLWVFLSIIVAAGIMSLFESARRY